MFTKLLVANRGEIAIRAFRAAYELNVATVAVYPFEDRNSLHRLKADESYQIGEQGHPVRAYLSVNEIVDTALACGADAIYPGYGFLSENPELAAACAAADITFVGPSADVLELTGNKARAITAASEAGLPVLRSSAPSADVAELMAASQTMEFPLFVKAVAGGGGRGMRRVTDPAELPEAIEAASREAESAFGDSSKVVGDLALALVGAGVSAEEFAADPARYDIPDSVIGFLRGELGDPPGGWPEPLRTKALRGRGPAEPTQELTAEDDAVLASPGPKRQETLNRLLFPGPTREFEAHRDEYGDTSQLSDNQFFYGLRRGDEHRVRLEQGVELLIGMEAVSDPDERGMRTVMCILNGQLRPVTVRDRSIASAVPPSEKADRANPDQIAAPFGGVVTVVVNVGNNVEAGETIATIEAMKMKAAITAPKSGTVQRIAVSTVAQVEGGDLLAVLGDPDGTGATS